MSILQEKDYRVAVLNCIVVCNDDLLTELKLLRGRGIGCDKDLTSANRTTLNEAPLARLRHLDGCRRALSFQRSVCAC